MNTTAAPTAAAPSFAAAQSFAAGEAPSALGAADVNGDGRPDLLLADQAEDSASVLLNTTEPGAAAPSFAAAQSFAAGEAPSALGAADVNGDGRPDLLLADQAEDSASVLLNAQYAASVSPGSVTGTIRYAIPQASFSPGALAFGERLVGSATSRSVVLTNTGGETLDIDDIAVDGPGAGQLSQASSCPPALAVGESCPITVTFVPSAVAAASAALAVTSSAPTSPDVIGLSGTGYASPSPPVPVPPAPTPGVSPSGDGVGPRVPARLRIGWVRTRSRRSTARLALGGSIAKAARGAVEVTATIREGRRRFGLQSRAPIHHGRWRGHLTLAGFGHAAKVFITVHYPRGPGVRSGRAKHRLRLGS
jgi:hypothetical protein